MPPTDEEPIDQSLASDARLVDIARGSACTSDEIRSIAAELIRARKSLRGDSRTSQQVKRMRYAIEAIPSRVEELKKAAENLAAMIEKFDDERAAAWERDR